MIRRGLLLTLLPLVVLNSTAFGQQQSGPLSDSEIAPLLTLGQTNKLGGLVLLCTARKPSTRGLINATGLYGVAAQALANSNNVFSVRLMTARGHVAMLAREAKASGKTLTPPDIGADDRASGLRVRIAPYVPDTAGSWESMTPAEVTQFTLAARTDAGDESMTPDRPLAKTPITWKNPEGVTIETAAAEGFFSGRRLQGLSARPITLTVTTQAGIRVCDVSDSTFRKLLKATK